MKPSNKITKIYSVSDFKSFIEWKDKQNKDYLNYVTNLIANHKNEMESWELKEYEAVLEDYKNKVEYLTNYINENAEFFA